MKTTHYYIYRTLIAALVSVFALASCVGDRGAKPTVTVTIEPLRSLVEDIVGDRIEVVTLVPAGSSPETYEPTARQMVELSASCLYVKVGNLGFERTWMERLKASAPQLTVVDASEGIAPLGGDPHVWTSPRNMEAMARNVYRALAAAQPQDTACFRPRLDSLCASLRQLDAWLADTLAQARHRSFLIYHPALSYFARDYGLRQIAIEEEGREPSAASLQAVLTEAKAQNASLLFVQKEFGGRNVESVREATQARPVEINPLGYDWQGELKKIARTLCNP